jgi:colanic acid biosynthesis glycosyl transferase WcaI
VNTPAPRRSTILLISQVYVPDPASSGQHMAGAAAELARRGHRVVVVTASNGYDDPSIVYPRREVLDGVEVRRVPFSSFGKGSIRARLAGGLIFLAQAIAHGLTLPRLDIVIVTTPPPMASLAALVVAFFRDVRVRYWLMDLNPDQAVALGFVRRDARSVRLLEWLNRRILARADDVIVLDRFMADRVVAKYPAVRTRLTILPPWPLHDAAEPLSHDRNGFRAAHGLQGKFVVMYSGNHTPANPLSTLLHAAIQLESEKKLEFVFVGGGLGKREVEACGTSNIQSLPYQPLSALHESLSAADLHVVSIGEAVVGMVHPCKVYGAMAVARPILVFGPAENHIADLLREHRIGWHVRHGDVAGTLAALAEARAMSASEWEAMGRRAQQVVVESLSREKLTSALCDVLLRPGAPMSGPPAS